MFERRLKIVLVVLALFTVVLILRAGQVQVIQNDKWTSQAAETMKRSVLIDTVRGAIRDRKGKLVAHDTSCVDVCVDYRALTDPPEPKWLAARGLDV
jgi:cell division protein FtsI/penicillin-binding protein 2